MIDYDGYKEYLIKIGFSNNSLQTYPSYISENKIDILKNIERYQNLDDNEKLIKFSNEDNDFKEEYDLNHTFTSDTTFNDCRSGARRYKYYLKYLKIIEIMNDYLENKDNYELNKADIFYQVFNDREYPIKVICSKNLSILELEENFTIIQAKNILQKIFDFKGHSNITFINKNDIPEPPLKYCRIKNIILYGVAGVGKTHNTKKLISLIESGKSDKEIFKTIKDNALNNVVDIDTIKDRVKFITFHQSFGYEDFIEGFRPNKKGNIRPVEGIFKSLCEKADEDEKQNYYLVIDEINRGNVSKIFGELITLIEEDKRDTLEVTLPYSKITFTIPSNLYIIGTMNTTDKSIALIDIALRRRFTFLEMKPKSSLVTYPKAKEVMEAVNNMLTEEYQIGHSYFMKIKSDDDLDFVWDYKITPLLKEYYYGDEKGLIAVLALYEK
ncbi:MAG: AAA family ATPase [Sulfurovum sp.]|nr:AAA family ATPase [Sulfurovum sp.]